MNNAFFSLGDYITHTFVNNNNKNTCKRTVGNVFLNGDDNHTLWQQTVFNIELSAVRNKLTEE